MESSIAVPVLQRQLEDPLAHLPTSTVADYPKGSTIYNQHHVSTGLYLVMEGRVKVSQPADNGREVLIDVYRADDLFGESAFLNVPHCREQAMALERTRLMT